MKHRILLFALVGAMCLSITACGGNGSSNADIGKLEDRIAELEAENAELKSQLSGNSSGSSDSSVPSDSSGSSSSQDAVTEPQGDAISLGDTCTIPDLCEFTVSYADLKKEVLPPKPASFYTYYQEEDGMTYLDVAVSTKNLRTTARRADDFGKVKAICGAGYEYTGFSVIEEKNGGNFTYTNITNVDPLETAVIHYLIKIPNEIADDSSASITLDITMLDNNYSLAVR